MYIHVIQRFCSSYIHSYSRLYALFIVVSRIFFHFRTHLYFISERLNVVLKGSFAFAVANRQSNQSYQIVKRLLIFLRLLFVLSGRCFALLCHFDDAKMHLTSFKCADDIKKNNRNLTIVFVVQ